MLTPKLLATMARNPNIFHLLTSTEDNQDIRQLRLRNPGLVGRRIGKVVLPGDTLVLTIQRNGDVLIPHGSTRLELDDQVSILGSLDALEDVQALFRKNT
jgi:Trk K+ transport system NAD-binding subunit